MLVDNYSTCVSVELLDGQQLHSLQSWTFDEQEVIRIGRSDEQDVTIANPHVSRLHAELRLEIDGWRIVGMGRNGVLLNGDRVDDAGLSDRSIIRLGSTGPTLRFLLGRSVRESGATVCEESSSFGLEVDEARKQRDVESIVNDDFFQQLSERADDLRRQREQ